MNYDVAVVGAGPAGSVMAWALASEGARVVLIDRAKFPRDKVCGDFVEPRGLRILERMGCLAALEKNEPLPIRRVAMYVDGRCAYRGAIPFYGRHADLPPHGYIIPRDELDDHLLRHASNAGATVRQEAAVRSVVRSAQGLEIGVARKGKSSTIRAQLVVGADGVNSVVAKSAGLLEADPRTIAVAQRAYVDGIEMEGGAGGEATFVFDREVFPGYGWLFPIAGGRANIGVGILSEARQRFDIRVPELFDSLVEKLRTQHPGCANLRVSAAPIGGIVKTYGGAGRNHFERGILIGDAGCFVDPMTGEGITPAMESAMIGAPILLDALGKGAFDAAFLSAYERAFRRYFDPSLLYVDLCASLMRNRCFAGSWLRAMARGCELAEQDEHFARTSGAGFGGMEVQPASIATQVWAKVAQELGRIGVRSIAGLATGDARPALSALRSVVGWQLEWWESVARDPLWHALWTADVAAKWIRVAALAAVPGRDPREAGLHSEA
jgi:geranylgeranyl reductase family protein